MENGILTQTSGTIRYRTNHNTTRFYGFLYGADGVILLWFITIHSVFINTITERKESCFLEAISVLHLFGTLHSETLPTEFLRGLP